MPPERYPRIFQDNKREGYRRLGVRPNDVATVPAITPFLKRLPGGIPFAIEAIRASSAPEARQFLQRYDDMTVSKVYRSALPIEAYCLAAGLDPSRLMGIIIEVAHRQGAALGAVTAAMAHPEIVEKSVEIALTPMGTADREWNLKHMGFLPSPKGSQVNVQVNATANAQQAMAIPTPSPEDAIRRLQDKFNEGRTLPAAGPQQQLTDGSEKVDVLAGMRERTLDAMAPVLRQPETGAEAED